MELQPQCAPGADAVTMCTVRESGQRASPARVKRTEQTSLLLTALLLQPSVPSCLFFVLGVVFVGFFFTLCGECKLNALFHPLQDRAHPARGRKFIPAPANLTVFMGLLSAVAGGARFSREKRRAKLREGAEPNLSALSRAELGKTALTSASSSHFSQRKGIKKTDCDGKPDIVSLWHCISAVRCYQKNRNR